MSLAEPIVLPRPSPARVLALGAYLKNSAALLDGAVLHRSAVHGDLGTADACTALEASAEALLQRCGGRVDAIAHDLHPDFFSTHLAHALARRLGVPALAVQHHHAHIAVVQAEQGLDGPVIGLALDGVGLGSDGAAWGGEVLRVDGAHFQRLAHLSPLALPGGDVAAREPWRMAAAALHAWGRGDEIEGLFGSAVGVGLARGVRQLLDRRFNCPPTTAAGRWFDALAGLLGLSVRQATEAEAAVAVERAASSWMAEHPGAQPPAGASLDLRAWLPALVDAHRDDADTGRAAAAFHLGLAQALAEAAEDSAQTHGTRQVVLAGGCFFNRLLAEHLPARLRALGLVARLPRSLSCGDAGLPLGQAWVAAAMHAGAATQPLPRHSEI